MGREEGGFTTCTGYWVQGGLWGKIWGVRVSANSLGVSCLAKGCRFGVGGVLVEMVNKLGVA